MPLLDNAYDPVLTPNVYLENKQPALVYPPIKPFDIELTPSVAQHTQVPDNYRAAFDVLDKMKKTPFVPLGDSFGTKDTNVFGVQNMTYENGVDNEGLAALKQDDVLSKGLSGMFDVAKASFFSQINTIPNFFSSIVTGKDVFKDNEQNAKLAESLKSLEEDKNKIFKSLDQRENPLKFGNIFSRENFGSLLQQTGITFGTIGGILLENLAIKVGEVGLAATGVGTGAALGTEVANDIRSSLNISKALGSMGKAIKSILTGVSTITKSYATAKGINAASSVVRNLNLAELGVRAFLHANGEAALQRHIAREDIINALVDQEGNDITQDKLDKIHQLAEEGADTEYAFNLPLLMVSDMYQFGNVLMGKQLNHVLDKFPVSAKLAGNALQFSGKAPTLSNYLMRKAGSFMLKSQVEGLEEIGQYGIEQFTRSYYQDLYNNKTTRSAHDFVKHLGKGAEHMFTEEGISQYISGVLIGGITNVSLGAITSAPQIAANPKRFFSPYSSYKETIENAFDRNNALAANTLKYFSSVAKQSDAFQKGDKAVLNDEIGKQIYNFTDINLKRGTYDHIVDTIKSWSTLNNEQFNESGFAGMGESLTETEQKKYVSSLLTNIELAKQSVESTQRVFKVNPFENENWFIRKLTERGKSEEEIVTQKMIKIQNSIIFNQLRDVAGYLTFKKEHQSARFDSMVSELKQTYNSDFVDNMLGDKPSIKNYLMAKQKDLEQQLAIYTEGVDPKSISSIPGVKENRAKLRSQIAALNEIKDKPESELTNLLTLPEELKEFITDAEIPLAQYNKQAEQFVDSFKLKQSVRVLGDIYKSWETIEGQRELINSILKESVYNKNEQTKKEKAEKVEEVEKVKADQKAQQESNPTDPKEPEIIPSIEVSPDMDFEFAESTEKSKNENNQLVEKRKLEDFNNPDESYRVIVGEEAYNDIVESGVVRTNAETKSKNEGKIDLSNRPTAFPSFTKGKASMEYAAENPNNYIIVTEDPSIQPSKVGRHGKGTTMFPTDENGNHLKELSGEKVKVYKHVGNGEYILVYANGEEIIPSSQFVNETEDTDNEELIDLSNLTTMENVINQMKNCKD